MVWWMSALMTAFAVALAHHLGLVGKVGDVVRQIAGCARCSVFWVVLGVMLMQNVPAILAAACAIVLAYLTDWLGLLFFTTNNIYSKIWQRLRNRNRHRTR